MKTLQEITCWFYLNGDEFKGGFKVLLWILVILLLIKSPMIIRNCHSLAMDSETTAVIDTIIQNQGIRESYKGGNPVVQSYRVDYHYEINHNLYKQSSLLDRKVLGLEERFFLRQLIKGDFITINYKSDNPYKATLNLRNYSYK